MPRKRLSKAFHSLNLDKKFALAAVACIIFSMALLTALIIRREAGIMVKDSTKNAEILAASISASLTDSMLGGRSDDTLRLIWQLRRIQGVEEISVLKPEGEYAFGVPGSIEFKAETREKLLKGSDITFSDNGMLHFFKPLMSEERCRSCHPDNKPLRGVLLIRLSEDASSENILDLTERMAGFGLVAALVLSMVLIALTRSMLLSPLKGISAATELVALGDFELYKPRENGCREIMDCKETGCPSYEDVSLPCWLQSGTLCHGRPTGHYALKNGDCLKCRVYKDLRGDEIVQLQDNFNRMVLNLKSHERQINRRLLEIGDLNEDMTKSNLKLKTLLEASRLTTSSLDLDEILTSSLRIILNVTNLKAGLVLLLEEHLEGKCYEYFDCDAFNCPAYKADVNCWLLSGTTCHGDACKCPHSLTSQKCWESSKVHTHYVAAANFEEKITACSNCEFFANVVLIPRMTAGLSDSIIGKRLNLDSRTLHKAMMMGRTLINHSGENPFRIPIDPLTEVALPLRIKEQIIGVLYLAADTKLSYSEDEIEFFQLLSEVISLGVYNSRLYDDMETSYLQTVTALANALEAKDPYTRGHSERVSRLCAELADGLRLSKQEKEHLMFAAVLHDVGKIGVGRDVLQKAGALDTDEMDEIRSHPARGAAILEPVHFLKPILPAIRHHHESFDGSGYPLGLRGKEIPFKARILSVADTWDAMLSTRPYRDALSEGEAKKELLRCSGQQFDPEVVEALLRMGADRAAGEAVEQGVMSSRGKEIVM